MENKKTRWFSIQRNYDFETHDSEKNVIRDITEDEWREETKSFFDSLVQNGKLKSCALIFHDKDEIETGFKPLHLHAIVEFTNARYKGGVVSELKATRPENVEILNKSGSRGAMARYLLHVTDKAIKANKHIYGEDEVMLMGEIKSLHTLMNQAQKGVSVTDSEEFAISLRTRIWKGEIIAKDALDLIFEKFADSPILAQQLYDKNKEFYKSAEELYGSRLAEAKREARNLTNIYVTGAGGSGKTSMAVGIAHMIDKVRHPYITPPPADDVTYDLADGYHYEKVAVVDDLDPTRFSPLGFTGQFDQTEYRMSSARRKNKHFLPDVAFIAIERDIENYISDMLLYCKGGSKYAPASAFYGDSKPVWNRHEKLNDSQATREIYHQVERRFSYIIIINGNATLGNMTINVFEFMAKSREDVDRYRLIARDIPWANINYKRISANEEIAIDDNCKKIHDDAIVEIHELLFENFNKPDLGHYENVYRDMKL